MALKRANGGAAWSSWDRSLVNRDAEALERARRDLGREVREVAFEQWLFFEQWADVRRQARERGIRILGDIPIFVAQDSADVWAHPEIFHLAADGRPSLQAGVPPDYFSATGQLWGNPLYRWEALARTGYAWWIDRFRAVLALVDTVRLDHFRGFEAYWEVPGDAQTAVDGRWVKGPGAAFFEALEAALGELPIVAEDLGVITPEVEALRDGFGFPGMAILQFAFGNDPQAPSFRPHAYAPDTVAYTGTHDNDTVMGWWRGGAGSSVRTQADVEREKAHAQAYLASDGKELHWDMIRALHASVADDVITPMQDVLGLGSEARMNTPATLGGNWTWRLRPGELRAEDAARLAQLVELYDRNGQGPLPSPRERQVHSGLTPT
jgi:4-alpha-glucanotransferase